jgi:hypothetical protein
VPALAGAGAVSVCEHGDRVLGVRLVEYRHEREIPAALAKELRLEDRCEVGRLVGLEVQVALVQLEPG